MNVCVGDWVWECVRVEPVVSRCDSTCEFNMPAGSKISSPLL